MNDVIALPLYARDGTVKTYALIDAADGPFVTSWRWYLSGRYVRRFESVNGRQTAIALHRELSGLPRASDGREVDHANRNPLDNRRSNLRVVTHAENMQNRPASQHGESSHRGVYWDRGASTWIAQVTVNGRKHRKFCPSEDHAATAAAQMRADLMPFSAEAA